MSLPLSEDFASVSQHLDTYFPDLHDKLLQLGRSYPAVQPLIVFSHELLNEFTSFRDDDGRSDRAEKLRIRTNCLVCDLVKALIDADCVFIRRLQTDGSVKLYGEIRWGVNEIGRPPIEKERNEGVSSRILNKNTIEPEVIVNVNNPDDPNNHYYEDHRATLANRADDSDVIEFVQNIGGEVCVPLTIRNSVFAGIVGIRWKDRAPWRQKEVLAVLKQWQPVFENLYHAGLRLEQRELLHNRIIEFANHSSLDATPISNERFFRKVVTHLTCDAGLRWHRAFLFLFDGPYPAPARCLIAIGHLGNKRGAVCHQVSAGWSFQEFLQATEKPEFAIDDPLYRLSQLRPFRIVIPEDLIQEHRDLHTLFTHAPEAGNAPNKRQGLLILNENDNLLLQMRWSHLAFSGSARHLRRFICPLFRPTTKRPIGFILLDNPYPTPREMRNLLPGTRLICDMFAAELADRGFDGENELDTSLVEPRRLQVEAETDRNIESQVEQIIQNLIPQACEPFSNIDLTEVDWRDNLQEQLG